MSLTHRELEILAMEVLRGIPAKKSRVAMTPESIQRRANFVVQTQEIIDKGGIVEIPFDLGPVFDPEFYEESSDDDE